MRSPDPALVVALAACVALAGCSRGPVPALTFLGNDGVATVKAAFNAHPERTRVLALLSPT